MAIRNALPTARFLRRSCAPAALRAAGVAVTLLVCGTSSLQNAVANGDTRTLVMHHTHSGESGTFTFKKNGRYDQEELARLNHFLRDWRNQKPTQMDPALFDIVWEVYRETDATAPIQIVSAYRSPETNAMLRSRSRGVAQFSQHMLGKAMDFFIPGVNLTDLRVAGLRLQRGGVGFYPTSGSPFVHMDTGNVRHWPRMTHDQLARVFPDGKTVHVPTDGRPLAHYDQALAEIQARGSKAGVAVASADGGKGVKNLFAGLFGKKGASDDDEGGESVAPTPGPARTADASEGAPERAPVQAAALPGRPLPPARPAEIAAGALVAQASTSGFLAPLPLPRPAEAGGRKVASLTAAGNPAPLPAIITRGASGPAPAEDSAAALGYAAAWGPRPDEGRYLAGGLMTHAAAEASARPAPSAAAQSAAAKARAAAAAAAAPVEPSCGFLSPSLSAQSCMRTPEVNRLADLMEPAHVKVALASTGPFQAAEAARPAPAAPLAYARRM